MFLLDCTGHTVITRELYKGTRGSLSTVSYQVFTHITTNFQHIFRLDMKNNKYNGFVFAAISKIHQLKL